jgi:hypothetical protein
LERDGDRLDGGHAAAARSLPSNSFAHQSQSHAGTRVSLACRQGVSHLRRSGIRLHRAVLGSPRGRRQSPNLPGAGAVRRVEAEVEREAVEVAQVGHPERILQQHGNGGYSVCRPQRRPLPRWRARPRGRTWRWRHPGRQGHAPGSRWQRQRPVWRLHGSAVKRMAALDQGGRSQAGTRLAHRARII